MNNNTTTFLKSLNNQDVMEQFISILELEDTKFDAVYPKMKEEIVKVFELSSTRKSISEQLSSVSEINLEEELKSLNTTIRGIKEDDSLSTNKKDLLITLLTKSGEITASLIQNPREIVAVKVQKINEDAILPTYAHDSDAGADIYSVEDYKISPHSTIIVKTGLKVAIPKGYEIQIRARSGLSLKTPLRIANCVGTIKAA